jgi:trimeric autotransporter adhesin
MVTVVPGTGAYNRWSFDIDSSTFKPDEYLVKVSGVTVDVTASTTFNIVERKLTAPIIPVITTLPATPVLATTTAPQVPEATTAKSPLPLWIIVVSCCAALLVKRGS